MLIGSWVNLLGIILRFFSTLPAVPEDSRFTVVMCGQGLAALAQPFLLFTPTKLAAVWFPDNQRAIANTLGSMSNPLGILVSFLLSSLIVSKPADIPTMVCTSPFPDFYFSFNTLKYHTFLETMDTIGIIVKDQSSYLVYLNINKITNL